MCEHNERLTRLWNAAVSRFADALTRSEGDQSGVSGQGSDEVAAALACADDAYRSLQEHAAQHACGMPGGTTVGNPLQPRRRAALMCWSDGCLRICPWEQCHDNVREPQGFAMCRAFSAVSVERHAPDASGVYGLSNAREWIYIGETSDVRSRLFEHLTQPAGSLNALVPTGFAYEVCDPDRRIGLQNRLVMKYEPVCNRRPKEPERTVA